MTLFYYLITLITSFTVAGSCFWKEKFHLGTVAGQNFEKQKF